jgi:hypothetical protein
MLRHGSPSFFVILPLMDVVMNNEEMKYDADGYGILIQSSAFTKLP